MSNCLWHGLQHTKLPCPSLSPRVCSNSWPLSWWCHPTISSCHPLLLLPSIFPSIRGNELTLHIRWPMNWSFSFSVSPSSEYSGLISFRIDWFDLLAVLTCWHCRKYVCSWTHQPSFLFVHDPTIFFLKSKAPVIFLALLFFFERREELAITVCVYIYTHIHIYIHIHTYIYIWRRQWQPTPVFLPGEFHGQRSLVGCCPWVCTELDTTEVT